MPIPKYQEILVPALKLLEKHRSLKLKDFEKPLATEFGLMSEEVVREYPSGNGRIFYDRVSWALSSLYMAGLAQKPSHGVYQISEVGRTQLNQPNNIRSFIAGEIKNRGKAQSTDDEQDPPIDRSPLEELSISSNKIRQAVLAEIIDAVLSKKPQEFEKLVVLLLQRMGYGSEVPASGEVTPFARDGGIDGIIKEDVLGLGRIYIQAKRYARDNKVPKPDIQKFVGALAGKQSSKGVFITTSSFTDDATAYAATLSNESIVLIDGMKLAGYIYDFGLGMQIQQTIELKRMDGDFWDSMSDIEDDG